MTERSKGLLITFLGVLFVVPDSLFVRLIDSDPMTTAFWRGLVGGSFIFFVLIFLKGIYVFKPVLKSGYPGVIYIFLIGSTTPAFVLAVTHTSVANVVFIFASIPIFSIIFSFIFIGEKILLSTFITSFIVIIGLTIIAYGSQTSEISSWKGDMWAIYVSAAYAGALTSLRKLKEISMVPTVPVAFLGSALIILIFHFPFEDFNEKFILFLSHGFFIGVASWLLTLGPRYLSSPEVSLLILLETVFAPILVWVIIGESPGYWAIVGGSIIILTLFIFNLYKLSKEYKSD